MVNVESAKQLIKDIWYEIDNWDERSSFKIRGITNLSRSDLDMLELYANRIIDSGGDFPRGMLSVLGRPKEVMEAYHLPTKNEDYWG